MEIVDSETGLVFEVLRTNENTLKKQTTIKSEQSIKLTTESTSNCDQEIVSLNGSNLFSLGKLDSNRILMAVPKIPDKFDTTKLLGK